MIWAGPVLAGCLRTSLIEDQALRSSEYFIFVCLVWICLVFMHASEDDVQAHLLGRVSRRSIHPDHLSPPSRKGFSKTRLSFAKKTEFGFLIVFCGSDWIQYIYIFCTKFPTYPFERDQVYVVLKERLWSLIFLFGYDWTRRAKALYRAPEYFVDLVWPLTLCLVKVSLECDWTRLADALYRVKKNKFGIWFLDFVFN